VSTSAAKTATAVIEGMGSRPPQGCTFAPMVRQLSRLDDGRMQTQRTPPQSPPLRNRPDTIRIGRYSIGIEQLDDTPAKLRRGRFSTGIEQLSDTPAKLRRGRFSTGNEQLPASPAKRRRGSFATSARRS